MEARTHNDLHVSEIMSKLSAELENLRQAAMKQDIKQLEEITRRKENLIKELKSVIDKKTTCP